MTGLVEIYDATHGRLVAEMHPDAAITAAVRVPDAFTRYLATAPLPAGPIRPYAINYTHVLWSPHGK